MRLKLLDLIFRRSPDWEPYECRGKIMMRRYRDGWQYREATEAENAAFDLSKFEEQASSF